MQLENPNKLTAYTAVYLRGLCKEYGLPHTGIRAELIERLREFIEGVQNRGQNQSQSVIESTPTRRPVEPVQSVRTSTVEKTAEETPGDDAQPRPTVRTKERRTPRKPPASFFADPPVRLFAVAVEIPLRPPESSDYDNLNNGGNTETLESSGVEASDDEDSQSEPEPEVFERQRQTAIRGRPLGRPKGSRGRGRGRGRSRGGGGRASRSGRTTRSTTREANAEEQESEAEFQKEIRTATPSSDAPLQTRGRSAKTPDEQTIPTPPRDENDVEMEDASVEESETEDVQEVRSQKTGRERTTNGDTSQTGQKGLKTANGTEGIPGLGLAQHAMVEAAPSQDETSKSYPEPEVQRVEESGAPAQIDVEMKDAVQPVPAQAVSQTTSQEAVRATGVEQQADGYANAYVGVGYNYNAQSGYDHQAYIEYYRAHGFDYQAWYDQQMQAVQQQEMHKNQQTDPYYHQVQEQQSAAAASTAAGPTDYTEVPAPINLPVTHTVPSPATAPEQPEDVPDARKRKRGETPPPPPVVDESSNKKQKQDEPVHVESREAKPTREVQQEQDLQQPQAQEQTVPSVQGPRTEQSGQAEQTNGPPPTPEKPRGKLSFSLVSRKSARPVANDEESLADIEPEESSPAWNGFSTDRPIDTNPSLHPPTRALYIDNLMRPLKEYALRDHLSTLAEPDTYQSVLSRTPADPVENCYLDPLKSHAFASFKTVEQAIRVRAALHNKVWPDERNRKPLQIDYFPEQLFSEWVVKERQSSSEGRVFKWRVAYKSGDTPNSVRAVLEEMGESNYQPFSKDNFNNDNRYANRRNSGGYNNYHYNKHPKINNHTRYYSQDSNSMITSPNFIPTGPRKSFDGYNRRKSSIDYDRPRKVYEEPVHIDDEKYYDDNFHGDEKDTSHVDDSKYYKSPRTTSKRKNRHRRVSSKEYSSKEYRDYSPPPRDRTRTRSPTPERLRDRSITKSRSPDRDRDRSQERSRARDESKERSMTRSMTRSRSRDRTPRDLSRTRSRSRSRSRDRTPRSRSRSRSRGRSRERSRDKDDDYRSKRHLSEAVVDGHSKHRDRDMDVDDDDDFREEDEKRVKIMNMDELFMFTQAKPKLYYLPVSEEVARERLKHREDMHKNARRYWRKKKQW